MWSLAGRRAACALLALVCALGLAAEARAQGKTKGKDPAEVAEAYYQQAIKLFNEGRYREALESFDQAIALQPEPVFYCNRGAVLLRLGEQQEALASMEACLARLETDDPEERAGLDAEVGALRRVVLGVVPRAKERAEASKRFAGLGQGDGKDAGGGGPLIVEPIDLGPSALEITAWGTGALGGVSLIGALLLDLITQPLVDEYKQVGAQGEDREKFDALRRAIEQRRVLVGGLVVLGGAALLTSGGLFWWDASQEPAQGSLGVRVGLDGAALEWRVGF